MSQSSYSFFSLPWRLCEQSCWCNKRTLLFRSLIRGAKHLEAKCDLLLEPPQQRNHSSCQDPSVMRRTKRCLSVLLWARMKDKAAVKRLSDITKDFATSCFLVKIHWFDCEHMCYSQWLNYDLTCSLEKIKVEESSEYFFLSSSGDLCEGLCWVFNSVNFLWK